MGCQALLSTETGQGKLGHLSPPVLTYSCVSLLLGSLSLFPVSSHTAVKGTEVPHPLVLTQSIKEVHFLVPMPTTWFSAGREPFRCLLALALCCFSTLLFPLSLCCPE